MVQSIGKGEWDEVRFAFLNSLMVDTPISSLAQNLELDEAWPIEGVEEVPSKYIGFSWEDIHRLPDLVENPQCVELLITILRETMAFDDPFSEMAETVENTTKNDDSLIRTLNDLKIPVDLPLDLSLLEQETILFCAGENVSTIGELASFSERLSRSGLLLGGNFQGLINALILRDEVMIANYLPYRPQVKGVHLIEAFDVMVRKLSDTERNSLLQRYGSPHVEGKLLDAKHVAELELNLLIQTRRIAKFFKPEMMQVLELVSNGRSFESFFMQFNDEEKKLICGVQLRKLVQSLKGGSVRSRRPVERKHRGFFARLFKRS